MAKLIYSAIGSLDGCVEDAEGKFEWAAPDDEVLEFVNDLERPVGTYLYGRGMYETMVYWETAPTSDTAPHLVAEYARIWKQAEKIVFSTSLDVVRSARTRLEREFEPEAIRELKLRSERDLTVGGAGLAGEAIRAGLVDEFHYFINPVVIGPGKRWLPGDTRVNLEFLQGRRFASGVIYLRYRLAGAGES